MYWYGCYFFLTFCASAFVARYDYVSGNMFRFDIDMFLIGLLIGANLGIAVDVIGDRAERKRCKKTLEKKRLR